MIKFMLRLFAFLCRVTSSFCYTPRGFFFCYQPVTSQQTRFSFAALLGCDSFDSLAAWSKEKSLVVTKRNRNATSIRTKSRSEPHPEGPVTEERVRLPQDVDGGVCLHAERGDLEDVPGGVPAPGPVRAGHSVTPELDLGATDVDSEG